MAFTAETKSREFHSSPAPSKNFKQERRTEPVLTGPFSGPRGPKTARLSTKGPGTSSKYQPPASDRSASPQPFSFSNPPIHHPSTFVQPSRRIPDSRTLSCTLPTRRLMRKFWLRLGYQSHQTDILLLGCVVVSSSCDSVIDDSVTATARPESLRNQGSTLPQ